MKRYIEIVYDNSGSMKGHIGGKLKYEIARELFEKEILPTIGLKNDHVVLRLLRNNCQASPSICERLPNQRNEMLDRIKKISHDQNTPLFYTILDAVEACRAFMADEYLIFVLTDGDDTCNVKIEDIMDSDTLNKYVRYVKMLLVQFAIQSPISKNNLTAFTNVLGGQTISLDSADSISQMRKKLKSALVVSGFSNKFPLEHCFDRLPGFDMTWSQVEDSGIDFHQSMLLYQKDYLSWMPDANVGISTLQLAELRFLFSLYFKTGVPEDLVKTMLSQLKKPYYYSFECVYWDFASARWRYFLQPNRVQQLPNEEAKFEDNIIERKFVEFDDNCCYDDNSYYRVQLLHQNQTNIPTSFINQFQLIETDFTKKVIKLKEGDHVTFEK
jgi:hypothetical protein